MEQFKEFNRFKFAFNYCNRKRKIEEPEQFWWAVQCFKKLHHVHYEHSKVRHFLKQFCVKSLHLGMQYCRRVDHERSCSCEYCFLFDNSKTLLIESFRLADCFVASYCDPGTLYSYRSACPPKLCYNESPLSFQNIDKWTSENNSIVLDYLKIYSVFNSVLGQ